MLSEGVPSRPDRRALQTLFDAYWGPGGWKPDEQRHVAPAELAHAKAAGIMFDDVDLAHDAAIDRACLAVEGVTRHQAAAAFVASLGSRRLEWRSALGTWTFGQWLRPHAYTAWSSSTGPCAECGHAMQERHDLNCLQFERHKWGGVRHDQPAYVAFDLEQLARCGAPTPTDDDARILRTILDVAAAMPAAATQRQLQKELARPLGGNKAERDTVLRVLAASGILRDPAHPGFATVGMSWGARQAAGRNRGDVEYPLDWWRGSHGVNAANAKLWFAAWL